MTTLTPADLPQAIETLADLLEEENAALERMDMPAVTALLAAKRDAFAAMQSKLADRPAGSGQLKAMVTRLQQASLDNKRLLERAIRVQQHVMSVLAQAARQGTASGRYGAQGSYLAHSAGPAFALSARA